MKITLNQVAAGLAAVSMTVLALPAAAQDDPLGGTLKIWAWADWDGPFNAVFDAFKEETGSTAILEFLPLADFDVEYNLVLKEATCDICFNFLTFDSYINAATGGFIMETSGIWAEDGLDDVMLGAENARIDGKAYALPMSTAFYPMLYANKAALEEAGAMPANGHHYEDFDEWQAAIATVKAAGKPSVAIQGGEDSWGGGHIIQQTFANNGTAADYAVLLDTDNPPIARMAEALRGYEKLTTSDMAIDGWQARNRDVTRSIFANGGATFFVGGSWSYGNIKDENPGLDLIAMPFPNMGPIKGQNGAVADSIVISAATKVPELARAFYAFAASKAGMTALASAGRIPARTDLDPELVKGSHEAIGAVFDAVTGIDIIFDFATTSGPLNSFINSKSGEIIGGAEVTEQMARDLYDAYAASQ